MTGPTDLPFELADAALSAPAVPSLPAPSTPPPPDATQPFQIPALPGEPAPVNVYQQAAQELQVRGRCQTKLVDEDTGCVCLLAAIAIAGGAKVGGGTMYRTGSRMPETAHLAHVIVEAQPALAGWLARVGAGATVTTYADLEDDDEAVLAMLRVAASTYRPGR